MTKTTCPDHEQLIFMATNDLTTEQHDEVSTHLTSCASCRQELSALQSALASMPDHTTPVSRSEALSFADRIVVATSRKSHRYYFRETVATCAAIGLIAFFVFKPDPNPVQTSLDMTIVSELAVLHDFELIENLDLLENLELLELLEGSG